MTTESTNWFGFCPLNRAHRSQVAKKQPETGGYYCVDNKARVRFRVCLGPRIGTVKLQTGRVKADWP